jgi:hypothetical protein
MKGFTSGSHNFQPGVPKPRTFSQTTKAGPVQGQFSTPASVSRGTTGGDIPGGRGPRGKGPLSVPRSGCCGKL